jgi:uncharacterized membrane protein YcaP (DUF421 family)
MEWKIHKLKNSGSDCLASYSYGKVKGDVAFVLPDGKEYKDLNESDVVNYVKKSINTMADGSIKESNVKNIEDTAKSLEEESSSNSSLPWAEPEPEESGED